MNNNKEQLWRNLYEVTLERLKSKFPDWIKNTHNLDRYEKYDNAAIDVALAFADISVYGEYKNCTEINLYESEKILHNSGIKTPKIPYGKLSEQEIEKLVMKNDIMQQSIDKVIQKMEEKIKSLSPVINGEYIPEPDYGNEAIVNYLYDGVDALKNIDVNSNNIANPQDLINYSKTNPIFGAEFFIKDIEEYFNQIKLEKSINQINIEQSQINNKNAFIATLPNEKITLDFLMGDYISMSYSSGMLYREYTTDFDSSELSNEDKKQLTSLFAEHIVEMTKDFELSDWFDNDKEVFIESLVKAGNDLINELEQKLQELEIDEQEHNQEIEELVEEF